MKIKIGSKITKWGNSYGLRLPKDFVASFSQFQEASVEITMTSKDTFKVKGLKEVSVISKETFRKAFKGKEFEAQEYDWGKDKGKEIW